MPRWIERQIPSMFHRRLALLTGAMVLVSMVLLLQLGRLTLAQAAERRRAAESVLASRELIPTARGRILDRRMRVLAADSASHDVSVNYSVISGRWAFRQAYLDARREHRRQWLDMTSAERDAAIEARIEPYLEQVRTLWSVLADFGGIGAQELTRRRTDVIERVHQIASLHNLRRLERLSAESDSPITLAEAVEPVYEETIAHPLLFNIEPSARVQIEGFIAEAGRTGDDANAGLRVWREVRITPSRERVYPHETIDLVIDRSTLPGDLKNPEPAHVSISGVGLHLLGTMRPVWKEDAQRRPLHKRDRHGNAVVDYGGYLPGDTLGAWGIEASQEDRLRGLRGQVLHHLDTGDADRLDPVVGRDVVLSVDIALQARIQALMDPAFGLMQRQAWHKSEAFGPIGEPLCGAAVVLEVSTGQVLAAVSVPHFTAEQLKRSPNQIFNDYLNRPFVNRAIGGPMGGVYQPGSTVKPLVLCAAATDRKLGHHETITCNGYLEYPNTAGAGRYRCWIYKTFNHTHGPLAGAEAIARSCNIYFYTLGRRLGSKRLVTWYRDFGLGQPLGVGLLDEAAGVLPDLGQADHPNAIGFQPADAIFMAIGQGPVQWTPLQAANAYATLARGGYHIDPTLFIGADESTRRHRDLQLDPAAVDEAMRGLYEAANESYGTGHHIQTEAGREPIFTVEGVRVMGKSGTADAVALREQFDDDGDGRPDRYGRVLRDGDHAWFVGLAQRSSSSRPDYVVAVVVEFAGSGGKVAGPIANQILLALRAEGYL